MGWGDCGQDSKGRDIGYVFPAACDESGCDKKIHRGLAYACGPMHGENGFDCEKYFCEDHRAYYIMEGTDLWNVCKSCYELAGKEENIIYDEDEGCLIVKS